MRFFYALLVMGIVIAHGPMQAQGCVAIRNQSCSGNFVTGNTQEAVMGTGDMVASLGYRHFKSFRHFRGTEEEANRLADGTEVINHFDGFDLGLTYGITDRISTTLILPFTINDRSSLYEHYGNSTPDSIGGRFHTQSAGLGDIRLSASYWLFEHIYKGNVAVGATIKFPTGKSGVQDAFHKLDQNGQEYLITQSVDQSIQLGDGALGVGIELQGYQSMLNSFSIYYSASYLSTPRNINHTLRRANADPENPYSYLSCPDQYSVRAGILYAPLSKLLIGVGGRIEGIPSSDLFGKSEGFRRPGYVISIEPGISVVMSRLAVSLNVPVALARNRTQNTLDKIKGTHGDAAFADYVINATVTYQINQHPMIEHLDMD